MKNFKLIAQSSLDIPDEDKCDKTYKLIGFNNYDNEEVKVLIKRDDFSSPTKLKAFLLDHGFSSEYLYEKKNLEEIFGLVNRDNGGRIWVVRRPGFHNGVYLTPSNEVIGSSSGQFDPMLPADLDCQLPLEAVKGYGREWRDNTSNFIKSSSRLMLAVCSSMSGMLIRFSNVQTGGFHFHGDSSIGKSTMLNLASSVYGNRDFVRDWNMTVAGAEELAEGASDSLLVLDEIKLLDSNPAKAAETASHIIYGLSEGRGKSRSKAYQSRNRKWHLAMISAGELSLNNHSKLNGQSQMAGERVRMIDVPADAGEGFGIFESIPDGYDSSAMAVDGLKEIINKHHGHAKARFRECLVDILDNDGENSLKRKIARLQQRFLKKALEGKEEDGQQKRVADRFALAYAAGVLAMQFKILRVTRRDLFEGIKKCFDDAVNSPFEVYESEALKALKAEFRMYFDDKLIVDLTSSSEDADFESGKAFKVKVNGKLIIAIPSKAFDGIASRKDFKELFNQPCWSDAIVKNSEGKNTHQVKVGNKKPRCYCFKVDLLENLR